MGLRVLNMMGPQAAEAIRNAFPDCEIVDVPWEEPLPDLEGDVLFAAWHQHPLFKHLDDTGVQWMHLPGTGIDSWPRELLEGRTVTCARGVSSIPIAEFVLAEMLAFEKHLPETWLSAPPEHWNVAQHGELAGNLVLGDAVQRGLFLVDGEAVLRLVVFHVPVDVHYAVGSLPEIANAARNGDSLVLR
jgi:phosphoglycerate dehydrogenase-like enzyme